MNFPIWQFRPEVRMCCACCFEGSWIEMLRIRQRPPHQLTKMNFDFPILWLTCKHHYCSLNTDYRILCTVSTVQYTITSITDGIRIHQRSDVQLCQWEATSDFDFLWLVFSEWFVSTVSGPSVRRSTRFNRLWYSVLDNSSTHCRNENQIVLTAENKILYWRDSKPQNDGSARF